MTMQETVPDSSLPLASPARRKTSFAGDTFRLVSGTAIAQALSILAAPVLTRFYAPEAFGLLAIFNSITGILGVIICLRYELTIVLPASDEEAANLFGVSMIFSVFLSLLTVPIVWWGGESLLRTLHAPDLGPYLWLIPIIVLFGGIGVGHPALNYWSTRTRRFKELSVTRVIGTVTTTGVQLGSGFVGFASVGGLILGSILGAISTPLILASTIWRSDGKLFLRSINVREMLAGIKRYHKFPLYDIWAALLNTISWQLPAFLLSAFFTPAVVGFYALGFRILQMPMSLIGSAMGQVFFQRAAEAKVQGALPHLTEGVFRRLVLIGLFPMLMLAIIGQDLYIVVFGTNWAEAGVYTQILSVWAFFWFISSPLSTLISVLEKQKFGLKLNIVIFLTRLGSLAIGGYLGNARFALLLFAGTGVLVYGYLSFALMAAVEVSWSRILTILGQGFLYFVPFGMLMVILMSTGIPSLFLVLASLVFFMIYILILWKQQPDLFHLAA